MKKRYFLFLLTILLSITFVGCGYTAEELVHMHELKENGAINAIKYIENKYGFKPTVVEKKNMYNDGGSVPDFTPTPNGMVHVIMEYQGREFDVKISGEVGSFGGADNYQKKEILSSLNDYIVEQYPMVKEAEFYDYEQDYYYFSELLTEDNIKDFIKDSYVTIKLCGNDITEFPIEDFVDEYECDEVNVIEYKDADIMPLLFNSGIKNSSMGHYMDSILPYINEYLWYDAENDIKFTQKVFTEYDKDIVVCTFVDEPVVVNRVDRNISDNDLSLNQRYLDSYQIQTNAKNVWIFVPRSMVTESESMIFYSGKYKEISYETIDYYYIDNLVIMNDKSSQFATCFIINICADEIR